MPTPPATGGRCLRSGAAADGGHAYATIVAFANVAPKVTKDGIRTTPGRYRQSGARWLQGIKHGSLAARQFSFTPNRRTLDADLCPPMLCRRLPPLIGSMFVSGGRTSRGPPFSPTGLHMPRTHLGSCFSATREVGRKSRAFKVSLIASRTSPVASR